MMTTPQNPFFIINPSTLLDPAARVAAVTDNNQTFALKAFNVDIKDVLEFNDIILQAPVTSSYLTVASVEDIDYK